MITQMPKAGVSAKGLGLRSKATEWSPLMMPSSCFLRSEVDIDSELGALIDPVPSSNSGDMLV